VKQRITVEQLNELSDEQKARLREWWKPQIGDAIISEKDDRLRFIGHKTLFGDFALQFHPYTYDCNACDLVRVKDCLPLLSIGQMIELLSGKVYDLIIRLQDLEPAALYRGIAATHNNDEWAERPELCDALFVAVKAVL